MPFCPNCGREVQLPQRFCAACGAALTPSSEGLQGEAAQQVSERAPRVLPYYMSANRVLVMSVLSYGSYFVYWFYRTWKQYRDHTGTEAYPVWHALALLVPIYGLFRTHAHMRCFQELMVKDRVLSTISPGGAVVLVLISEVVGWASFQVSFSGEPTQGTSLVIFILDLVYIAAVAGVLLHVQQNLNRYWSGLTNATAVSADVGVGEVIFAILGGLAWILTIVSLLGLV